MDRRIINLYDRFTRGGMTRRDFLDRLAEVAGSTAAATALLPLLQNNYAQAAILPDRSDGLCMSAANCFRAPRAGRRQDRSPKGPSERGALKSASTGRREMAAGIAPSPRVHNHPR